MLLWAVLRRVPARVYAICALGLVAVLFVAGLRHQVNVARSERDRALMDNDKLVAIIQQQNHAVELMKAREDALKSRVADAQAHAQQIDKQTQILLSEIRNQPVPDDPMKALIWLANNHNRAARIFNGK